MNAQNTKALFLDLDGTLLNDQKEITDGNRRAIELALSAGHKVIITTGRPLDSAVIQAERLGLTQEGCYVIAFNGGMIYDMGSRSIIYDEPLTLELMKKVMEEALCRGIHVQTYDHKTVLVTPECDDAEIRRYCSIIHTDFKVIGSTDAVTQKPSKVLLIDYENQAPLIAFQAWLDTWSKGILDHFFSCDYFIEVVPMGVNKGTAVRRMAEMLGIPMENTICAGDSANDLAMLQMAQIGCAMANATPEVKAIADYITTLDNNHDGIEEIIHAFLLNGETR